MLNWSGMYEHVLFDSDDTGIVRITVEPHSSNGLRKLSQVMVDKTQSVPREKVGGRIGRLDDETMLAVTRALAVFLGFA